MNKETESVIDFLSENQSFINEYREFLNRDGGVVSYSDLLMATRLNGTTKDGVNVTSSKVKRAEVSRYIKEVLNEGK